MASLIDLRMPHDGLKTTGHAELDVVETPVKCLPLNLGAAEDPRMSADGCA
jgi:hypothetical protein